MAGAAKMEWDGTKRFTQVLQKPVGDVVVVLSTSLH